MKTISTPVQNQIDADSRKPVYLLEIIFDAATVRFARTKSNIIFPVAGNIYYARFFEVPTRETSLEGQIQRITLKIDNSDNLMSTFAAAESFENKLVYIKKIYRGAIDSSIDCIDWFSGRLENISSIDKEFLTVSATEGVSLSVKAVSWKYTRMCPWSFGDSKCDTDGNANTTVLRYTGVATSGSITTLVCSGLGEVDDYWNYGHIEIVIDGTTYNRIVKDYVASTHEITLDVAVPVAISVGDTFLTIKGCDHTRETCLKENAWGPSVNNVLNFGGFLHIGTAKDKYVL